MAKTSALPLVVDLDGSLIRTDMLHETFVQAVLRRPLRAAGSMLSLAKGKAAFKDSLASHYELVAESLPYNQDVLALAKAAHKAGRQVVLASATDARLVNAIAKHLAIFSSVLATESGQNLSGPNKAAALNAVFGAGKYEYVGNSVVDLSVWKDSAAAIVVSRKRSLIKRAHGVNQKVNVVQEPSAGSLRIWLKQLRVHQWLKNVLLAVPMLAAFAIEAENALKLLVAFIAFSFVASGVYLVNDLVDLENDRAHHSKKNRPFAAGRIPLIQGLLAALVLFISGVAISATLGAWFLVATLVYVVTTFAYSFWLKRVAIIDCLILAFLYTIRVIAGGVAINVAVSFWLLTFSLFIFFSLAWVKRYAELSMGKSLGKEEIKGRGYVASDMPIVSAFGVASGFLAVVIFALYLDSDAAHFVYATSQIIWLSIPVLMFFIGRIWFEAHRGKMNEDPLIFAFKDLPSLISVGLIAAILYLAHSGVMQ